MKARATSPIDMQRMGTSLRQPGIDPRNWVVPGRVDDEDSAIRWDADAGWLVDVTLGGGAELDGELAVCRVASYLASSGAKGSAPIAPGSEVVVGILGGAVSTPPTIVGFLNNGESPAPIEVNGNTINEAFAKANLFLKTDKGLQEEYGDNWSVKVPAGKQMRLGSDSAAQSYVLGDTYQTNLNTFLTAVGTFGDALVAFGPPAPPTPLAPLAPLGLALSQAASALRSADYLSDKIKGEK